MSGDPVEMSDVLRLAMDDRFNLVIKSINENPELNLNARDEDGRSLLHWAAVHGNADTVDILLKHKVKVNGEDDSEYTPVLSAVAAGHLSCVQMLVDAGADLKILGGASKVTPLHLVKSSAALAEYLLDKGLLSSINQPDKRGNSPLHRAAARDTGDVLRCLLTRKANVNCKNSAGDTPLHVAALERHTAIIEALLAAGADRSIANKEGELPDLL